MPRSNRITFILTKCRDAKDIWELQKNTLCYFGEILEAIPYKTATV